MSDITWMLETFKKEWGGVRLTQYDDMLVYKVAGGWGERASIDANKLITNIGLSDHLIAEQGGIGSNDSFCVRAKS